MTTKTPRLTILTLMVTLMMTTVLGTNDPITIAFATAYGGNNDDLVDTDRITEDINRIITETFNDVDSLTQDLLDGLITELPPTTSPPPPGDEATTCEGRTATIVGTPGNDILAGTEGTDIIAGLGGNDRISGFGGNDLICGGSGNDQMRGDDGDDSINSIDDVVNNDNLDGSAGTDTCTSDPDPEVNCELP